MITMAGRKTNVTLEKMVYIWVLIKLRYKLTQIALPGWNTNKVPCWANVMLAKIPTERKLAESIIKLVLPGVKTFLYSSGFMTRKYRFMAVIAIS